MTTKQPVPAKSKQETGDPEVEQFLYAKREKIYPREVKGIFARWRVMTVFALLGAYYGTPWIQWQGRQAVLFDLPERKFYIFDWVFWPQDFFYLAVLLIIAAFALFFFTALAGRLWCGYACPQTVWTETFLWIERHIEGDRPKQMKLDKMPWNGEKLMKKGGKHVAWLTFSLFTGFTFVGYFSPIQDLAGNIVNWNLGPWEAFWVLFYSGATYLNAGWMREQVCIYMCPYARFQSAMFDKNTLIISYDEKRGDPRGKRKRGTDLAAANKGHCIDCTMCVQVCPTGIDIRDGLQYQCIACAACIDVCDDVMDKMDYPKGLIRYSTENAMEGHHVSLLRPRTLLYSGLIGLLFAGLIWAIAMRVPVRIDVLRDRQALYHETRHGAIENDYTVKILNMDEQPHSYRLTVEGIEGLEIIRREGDLKVASGAIMSLPLRLRADPENLPGGGNTDILFVITATDDDGLKAEQESRFLAPRTL